MVSLINFKTVDEDLSESQTGDDHARRAHGRTRLAPERQNGREVPFQTGAPRTDQQQQQQDTNQDRNDMNEAQGKRSSNSYAGSQQGASRCDSGTTGNIAQPDDCCGAGCDYYRLKNVNSMPAGQTYPPPGQMSVQAGNAASKGASKGNTASFTVTWRKLKFCIEPKWHERIASGSAALVALASRRVASPSQPSPSISSSFSSSSSSSSSPPPPPPPSQTTTNKTITGAPDDCSPTCARQAQPASSAAATTTTRVVLDQLDGSFRSGELTAILGPSGAGKTTLLDCLTGHRKSGLTGSVRFSLSSAVRHHAHDESLRVGAHCDAGQRRAELASFIQGQPESLNHKQKNLILAQAESYGSSKQLNAAQGGRKPASGGGGEAMQGDNLKVSIIPQNDHLIGHLTVYETLNYASKMKNCFEGEFDHKLNVRRVAQQLGLMSCLATRINKLSGGQYKRVSIAQELLSSPDVLILDEPTSGLDAMTCYQTVQVLKKLTDDCRTSGQKSIAVILTIHQPNSDVFQQFNHVYVVAQGGKCIYEGPPGNIESVINRVGICLPNSYYNPATMIVEIAAGKFGQDAIARLNAIQRKQYSESSPLVDEQNSTGDSAVDCPSSNEDDDDDDNNSNNNNNNNNDNGHGKINAGFTMDCDELDTNNNSAPNDKTVDNCCVQLELTIDSKTLSTNNCRRNDLESDIKQLDESSNGAAGEKQDRRKKRRRTRRRSGDAAAGGNSANAAISKSPSAIRILMSGGGGDGDGGGGGDGNGSDAGANQTNGREKRLKLNSLKADQKFPFWRHTYLHFHRSWLSIVRDPMLCSMQLALHIIVPVMVSLVYGTYVGKPNACPRAGPIDIMAYAMEPTDTALQLQEDLRTTLENIGYIFFKLYGIIFAAMTVTVLTFPLDMHVLVKEFRNGWYGLASYFLGRTLADIPFQLTLPLLAMSLSYYATGQPYSYMQWRFFSITAILILSSLIAQSQGLLFGAILMDKMKAAVFVAPAATTPIILFAGFLVRTQSIPSYLRPLSNLSYLRYAIEACLISRYGFNQCECDPAIFNQTVRELPPIARSMLDYWLSSYTTTPEPIALNSGAVASDVAGTALDVGSSDSVDVATSKPDLFTKLIDSLSRANSFGRNITSCEQVVPYPMIDYDLKDEQLFSCFAILLAMLIFTRLLTFFIVCYKVKRKV